MYEVYLEKSAEHDLRSLPLSIFQRIIPQIRALAKNQNLPVAGKLSVQKMIGGSESGTIASFTKLMRKPRPSGLCACGTARRYNEDKRFSNHG